MNTNTITYTKTICFSFFTRFAFQIFLIIILIFNSLKVNGQISCTGINVTPSPVCIGGPMNLSALGYVMNPNASIAFVDISATGTDLPGDPIADDSENDITLPFAFVYNGISYTTARVGNNGALVFGSISDGDIEYSNDCLPVSTDGIGDAGTAAICVFWDDMLPITGTSIKTQLVGTKYIIQWTNEDHFDVALGNTITYQIQLVQTTNVIILAYQDVIVGDASYNGGGSATIGLNFSETSSIEYSCNSESLFNGQSISFTPFNQIPTLTYAWTGPNGFNSSISAPVLTNCQTVNSGLYTVNVSNGVGSNSSRSRIVTVNNCTGAPINVKAFIQGYYFANGKMTPVLLNQGVPGATEATVDTIIVRLHKTDPTGTDPNAFYTVIDSFKAVIDTAGNAYGIVTAAIPGSYYFISVSGRNFIMTVSSDSILLNPTITSYNFTNSPTKAYGSNMFNNSDGTWSFFSGDVSQDEYVSTDDVTIVNNDNYFASSGFIETDISGDGYCGTDDVTLTDNNNIFGIASQHY